MYFTGTGKDCREQVQKLNEMRFAPKEEEIEDNDSSLDELPPSPVKKTATSKWSKYLEDPSD